MIQTPLFGAAAYDSEVQRVSEGWRIPLRGNPDARIIVLCEPPSIDAARQSLPMDLDLSTMWARGALDAGLTQDDFLFVGLCPPLPKTTEGSEKKKWDFIQPYVENVLEFIRQRQPAFVVAAGGFPARALSGRAVAINKNRGMFHDSKALPCRWFGMLSPRQVWLYPDNRPIMEADFSILKRVVRAGHDTTVLSQAHTDYRWVDDLQDWIDNPPATLGVDTETTGLDTTDPDFRVITVQLSDRAGTARVCRICPDYFPDHPVFEGQDLETCKKLRRQIKQLLENPRITKILHNGKYDFKALRTIGIEMGLWWDTELMARFVGENFFQYSLDEMIRIYVPEMAGYADHFNATVDKSNMMAVPPVDEYDLTGGTVVRPGMLSYAGGDPDAAIRLAQALSPILARDKGNIHVFKKLHMRALFAMGKTMETYGFSIDEHALLSFQNDLEIWLQEEGRRLMRMVPAAVRRKYLTDPKELKKGFKLSRDEVMRDILFSKEGFNLTACEWTDSTKNDPDISKRIASVSTKTHMPYFILEEGERGEFVRRYIEYSQAEKMFSTYAKGMWKYIRVGEDGQAKLIPSYNFRTNTRRTNCVHADTPVLTHCGEVPMAEVRVGDRVWTHKGRWREVSAVYCKAPAPMYNVLLSNGQNILCTMGHMFLTPKGWRSLHDVILEAGGERSLYGRGGRAALSGDREPDVRDRQGDEDQAHQRPCDHQPEHLRGRAQTPQGHSLPEQQAGDQEPLLWSATSELQGRVCRWTWIPDRGCGRGPLLQAPHRHGADAGYPSERPATGTRSASHRRGRIEQLAGQSCALDSLGAPDLAHADGLEVEVVRVEAAGVFPVYDLTVIDDASYAACGIVNHNSSDPNGQNFPKRNRWAKPFRKLIRASPGKVIIGSDLSQAELRIAAWMANEPTMLGIYRADGDIHRATAAAVNRMTMDEFEALSGKEIKGLRQAAKAVNFGFIYGAREQTFMRVAKTDYKQDFTLAQATEIRENYFKTYAGLPDWHIKMKALAHEFGYVKSLHGLTRHLPSIWSPDRGIMSGAERNAVNSPVQNFGSDLGVIALLRLSMQADPALIRPVGFIHDQLVAEVDENYVAEGMGWLKWLMENPPLQEWFGIVPPLPIKSDPEWGMNLGETTELGDDAEMQVRVAPHIGKPGWWKDDEEEAWATYLEEATLPEHFLREVMFS